LVQATLTGRNFGWEPYQKTQAVAHVARVIREDNGQDSAAANFGCGLPYAKIFLGTDPSIPSDCKIAPQYRIDVTTASDQAIVEKVAMVVAEYAEGLLFKQDELGRFIASPYDVFLRANHLPTAPIAGETETQYAQRLLGLVENLGSPKLVDGRGQSLARNMPAIALAAIYRRISRTFVFTTTVRHRKNMMPRTVRGLF
jgi:hypothetical protein